ncbi:fusaric acid resistance family protein [Sinobacterium caligoides]|uniref:Fusaric acid resistance family protein n=1 Tax=Sinobacterium caligoides TaxID=933926 RepID=A0A3N2DP80_9GAMM|nr:DUF2955 domain-containing protein [Sinobacterium caligoides]ROS01621.1 fusaric acid resistance family protein [Sinobacterium caligoides]
MKAYRIWFSCVLSLTLSLFFGWTNTMFVCLLPMLMLSRLVRWNSVMFAQMVLAVFWVGIETNVILGFLQPYPLLMSIAVAIMLLSKCYAMQHKASSLFGTIGLLFGSVIINIGSYPGVDLENFTVGFWQASWVAVVVCALAFYIFPEPIAENEPVELEVREATSEQLWQQTVLGWLVAMVIFFIFQIAHLNDSLSAQASMLIILSPMTLVGSLQAAKIRVMGTLYGCLAALLIQLGLSAWYDNIVLFVLAYAIAAALFSHWLAGDAVRVGIGFSAMSALIVPLTSSLVPGQQDAVYAIFYRLSSILCAVAITSLLIWLVHRGLQRARWRRGSQDELDIVNVP